MSARAMGIDLSHWHPVTSWEAIPEDIRFVGVKVSEGTANVDPTFTTSQDAIRARPGRFDLVVYYHLARQGDGAAQAARFLSLIGPLLPNERVALDMERTSAVGPMFIMDFFRVMPTDRRPILYTSDGAWRGPGMFNPPFPEAAGIDLWLPRYGLSGEPGREPVVPEPWAQIGAPWTFWQYSETAAVPGVIGECDANLFRGTADELRAYAAMPALTT